MCSVEPAANSREGILGLYQCVPIIVRRVLTKRYEDGIVSWQSKLNSLSIRSARQLHPHHRAEANRRIQHMMPKHQPFFLIYQRDFTRNTHRSDLCAFGIILTTFFWFLVNADHPSFSQTPDPPQTSRRRGPFLHLFAGGLFSS